MQNPKQTPHLHTHKYMHVPDTSSLYQPSSAWTNWRNEVRQFLENDISREVLLVFIIPNRLQDDWDRWILQHLDTNKIIAHLKSIQAFYTYLWQHRSRIQAIALGDILGSYCELAFCAQTIKVLSPYTALGFPHLIQGYFPLGGVCEMITEKLHLKRNHWLKQCCFLAMHAPDAFHIEIITESALIQKLHQEQKNHTNFTNNHTRTFSTATTLLYSTTQRQSDQKTTQDFQNFLMSIPYPEFPSWSLPHVLSEWQMLNHQKKNIQFESMWEIFWKKDEFSKKYTSLLRFLRQSYNNHGYTPWHYVLPRHKYNIKHSMAWLREGRTIYLIVKDDIPYFTWLWKWHNYGLRCVLIGESAATVSLHLGKLLQQCAEMYGKKKDDIMQAFIQYIEWTILSNQEIEMIYRKNLKICIISLEQNNKIHLRYQQDQYEFLEIFPQKSIMSLCSVAECPLKQNSHNPSTLPQLAESAGSLLFDMIIPTSIDCNKYVTFWLKDQLSEQIAQEGSMVKGGSEEVVKILKRMGWKIPHITPMMQKTRNTNNITDQHPHIRVENVMKDHFMIFATAMCMLVYHQGWVSNIRHSDLLVRFSYGIPSSQGSLWVLAQRRWGKMMLQEYAIRFFSQHTHLESAISFCFTQNSIRLQQENTMQASHSRIVDHSKDNTLTQCTTQEDAHCLIK